MDVSDTGATFHDGERAMQARSGVREVLEARGSQLIRNYMPDQHRAFFAQLPFVLAGSVDGQGQPWASLLCKPPGFIRSPDPRRLSIDALPVAMDPLHSTLATGTSIALLGIEQHTRRRNRANGRVVRVDTTGFELEVMQSFGNCPKYIQARKVEYWEREGAGESYTEPALNQAARQIIQRADTFFIATAHPEANTTSAAARGVDVSHRGGKPGFVMVDRHGDLLVPDFSGNRFFNTLGNLMLNPRAGLLFIDFETGDLLYIAALAEIVFDGPTVDAFAGAERVIRFNARFIQHTTAAVPLRWQGAVQVSPFLEQTGSWDAIAPSRQSPP